MTDVINKPELVKIPNSDRFKKIAQTIIVEIDLDNSSELTTLLSAIQQVKGVDKVEVVSRSQYVTAVSDFVQNLCRYMGFAVDQLVPHMVLYGTLAFVYGSPEVTLTYVFEHITYSEYISGETPDQILRNWINTRRGARSLTWSDNLIEAEDEKTDTTSRQD